MVQFISQIQEDITQLYMGGEETRTHIVAALAYEQIKN